MPKYIVENLETNERYTFYKEDDAQSKYKELKKNTSEGTPLVMEIHYPNYKTYSIETKIVETTV